MLVRSGISFIRELVVLLAISITALAPDATAQQLEPRAYSNAPVGLNFFIASYGYVTGSVVASQSFPLENAKVQSHLAALAYSRVLDIWGNSGKFDMILPYGWASGSADFEGQHYERDISGFGDPGFRFTVNLFGAPALSLEEFADYTQDLIIGASLFVSAPLGQYDSERLLNIGTNRWIISPELGMSKALGPLTLELSTRVSFFTDNDDFLGGRTRSQDPLYSVQGHVIYSFPSGIWAAADGTYYTGGRTSIDGEEIDDEQGNSRVGVTVAFPIDRHNSLKLYASTGVSVRTGGDFKAVGLAWQTRWGGGL